MKKGKLRRIAILIYVIVIIAITMLWMPDDEKGSFGSVVMHPGGNASILENGRTEVWVKTIDEEGNTLQLAPCPKAADSALSSYGYEGGTEYVMQQWYAENKLNLSVSSKAEGDSHYQKLWHRTIEEDITVSDFKIVDGRVSVIGVEQETRNVILFTYHPAEGEKKQVFSTGIMPIGAYLGNGGIYLLTVNSHIYYAAMNGEMTDCGYEDASFLRTVENGFYYIRKSDDNVVYRSYDKRLMYVYEGLEDMYQISGADNGKYTVVVTEKAGEDFAEFITAPDMEKRTIAKTETKTGLRMRALLVHYVVVTLLYFMAATLFMVTYRLVWQEKKLLYQTMTAVAVISALWMIAVFSVMYHNEQAQNDKLGLIYTKTCANMQKRRLWERTDLNYIPWQQYENSEEQRLIEDTLSANGSEEVWEELFERTELIYLDETPYFIFSVEVPYGQKALMRYTQELLDVMKECCENGENRTIFSRADSMRFATTIMPVGDEEKKLCLVTNMPCASTFTMVSEMMPMIGMMAASWLAVLAVLYLYLRRKWKPVVMVMEQMDKVSRGDYTVPAKWVPDNEFGRIWSSMERLCRQLRNKDYRDNGVLDYIYQFAPRNLEGLFDKENLKDVEVGETRRIPATVGIISIVDSDTLLKGRVQGQYVRYVNQLLEILSRQSNAEEGVFLQNGSNLEAVKAVFKEKNDEETKNSAVRGIHYALECIEELQEKTDSRYECNPYILLHTSDYLCGLAGGNNQAYPFVTSMELEMLDRYTESFKANGVRMVITEQTKRRIGEMDIHLRYIGYISSEDEEERFGIYEVLDACPKEQKEAKLHNDEKFQKALEAFYHNDFYLARSAFADVLKECPEDGIARWYVFVCEKLFNRGNMMSVRYHLFWDYE